MIDAEIYILIVKMVFGLGDEASRGIPARPDAGPPFRTQDAAADLSFALERRAVAAHARLGAAFPARREAWLDELRRMDDPAAEIAMWECCATALERFAREGARPLPALREALELLRRRRVGELAAPEFVFADHLSAEDVAALFKAYDAAVVLTESARDY